MDTLQGSYLDKHNALNATAAALIKAGVSVICARNLH